MKAPLKVPSRIPLLTIFWSASWVVGLSLLWIGSSARSSTPSKPLAVVSAPVVVDVEAQVRYLSARVDHLEAEVANLRAQPVAKLDAEVRALQRIYRAEIAQAEVADGR